MVFSWLEEKISNQIADSGSDSDSDSNFYSTWDPSIPYLINKYARYTGDLQNESDQDNYTSDSGSDNDYNSCNVS